MFSLEKLIVFKSVCVCENTAVFKTVFNGFQKPCVKIHRFSILFQGFLENARGTRVSPPSIPRTPCLQSVYTCMHFSLFVRKRAHTGYRVVRKKSPPDPHSFKVESHETPPLPCSTHVVDPTSRHFPYTQHWDAWGLGVAPQNHRGLFLRTFSSCISGPVRVAIVTVLACLQDRFGWAYTRLWVTVAGHMRGVGVKVRGLFLRTTRSRVFTPPRVLSHRTPGAFSRATEHGFENHCVFTHGFWKPLKTVLKTVVFSHTDLKTVNFPKKY